MGKKKENPARRIQRLAGVDVKMIELYDSDYYNRKRKKRSIHPLFD